MNSASLRQNNGGIKKSTMILPKKRVNGCKPTGKKTVNAKCPSPKILIKAPRGPKGRRGPRGRAGREGLLKWYDSVEIPDPMVPGGPAITSFTNPTPPAAFGPEQSIGQAFITLNRINSEDRVELKATIVWNFGFPSIDPGPGPEITVVSQQMQFSIWRDAALTGTRICTVVDSGELIRFPQVTPPPGTVHNQHGDNIV